MKRKILNCTIFLFVLVGIGMAVYFFVGKKELKKAEANCAMLTDVFQINRCYEKNAHEMRQPKICSLLKAEEGTIYEDVVKNCEANSLPSIYGKKSNWSVYMNKELAFRYDFPPEYKSNQFDQKNVLDADQYFYGNVYPFPQEPVCCKKILSVSVEKVRSKISTDEQVIVSTEKKIIGTEIWFKDIIDDSQMGRLISYNKEKDGRLYVITFTQDGEETFDKIAKSFRFLK